MDEFNIFINSPPLSVEEIGTERSATFTIKLPYRLELGKRTDNDVGWECALVSACMSRSWYNIGDRQCKIWTKKGGGGAWKEYEIPAGYYENFTDFLKKIRDVIPSDEATFPVDKKTNKLEVKLGRGYRMKFGDFFRGMFFQSEEAADGKTIVTIPYTTQEMEYGWDTVQIFVECPGFLASSIVDGSERSVLAAIPQFISPGQFGQMVWESKNLVFKDILAPEIGSLRVEIRDQYGRKLSFFRRKIALHILIQKKVASL